MVSLDAIFAVSRPILLYHNLIYLSITYTRFPKINLLIRDSEPPPGWARRNKVEVNHAPPAPVPSGARVVRHRRPRGLHPCGGMLFDKIKAVYDRRGSLGLDAVQTRLVEKIYGKFVRAGALLDPQQKERLRQINGELALLPVKFGNNVLRATNDFVLKLTDKQLDGLPASVQGIARENIQSEKTESIDCSAKMPAAPQKAACFGVAKPFHFYSVG